jgi:hypothetical protein
MDEQTRKAWSRPELIVIVRGRAEEAVLQICKSSGAVGSNSFNSDCAGIAGCGNSCEETSGS